MSERMPEMDETDRHRMCQLLIDVGMVPGTSNAIQLLAAYNAVLLKDVRFILNELLVYKQQEIHR